MRNEVYSPLPLGEGQGEGLRYEIGLVLVDCEGAEKFLNLWIVFRSIQ